MPNCFALPSVEKAPAWLDSPFLRGLLLLLAVNNGQDNKKIGKQTTNTQNGSSFFRRFADIFWIRFANSQKLNKTNTQGQSLQLKISGQPGDESSFLKEDSDRDHRY